MSFTYKNFNIMLGNRISGRWGVSHIHVHSWRQKHSKNLRQSAIWINGLKRWIIWRKDQHRNVKEKCPTKDNWCIFLLNAVSIRYIGNHGSPQNLVFVIIGKIPLLGDVIEVFSLLLTLLIWIQNITSGLATTEV